MSLTYAVPRERAAEYLQPRLLASLGPLSSPSLALAFSWPFSFGRTSPSQMGDRQQIPERKLVTSRAHYCWQWKIVGFRVSLSSLHARQRLPSPGRKSFNQDCHEGSVAPAPEDQNIQVRTNAPTCMPLGLGRYSQVKRVRRLWSSRTAKGGLITHIALHNRGARSGFLDDIESDSQWETRQG